MLFTTPPTDFDFTYQAVSCICEHNKKVLLLKRIPTTSYGGLWGPPGGKIDPDDKEPIIAAARELREETSIDIAPEKLLHQHTAYVRHSFDFVYFTFHVVLDRLPQVSIRDAEHDAYEWVAIDDLLHKNLIEDQDACFKFVYKQL